MRKPRNSSLRALILENGFDQVIDVALRVDAARDSEAKQFVTSVLAEHYRSDFDTADAGVAIQLDGQRLRGNSWRGIWGSMRPASM
jgi:hypothetical protein